ncbi:uncharacterized protein KY384_000862 [Bacidia gigantensis]|uniref:uncharacterized protein n=1 Tax=Bacidia gigantensis TaxID=2732470 RepID=UPI001D044253|nr:uncharacterized protein KY384_000862 [Bacidia gigantensis]KAG8534020.1 hypothetical protein KY384_000862 [Bacidia gigantensis]
MAVQGSCYVIVSPDPTKSTLGIDDGVAGRYFFIKFGDGAVAGTTRYSTNNPSYWQVQNNNCFSGYQYTHGITGSNDTKIGISLQTTILQRTRAAGGMGLTRVGDTEWFEIRQPAGHPNILDLGTDLSNMLAGFSTADLGWINRVPNPRTTANAWMTNRVNRWTNVGHI